jgi:hypothetical protein
MIPNPGLTHLTLLLSALFFIGNLLFSFRDSHGEKTDMSVRADFLHKVKNVSEAASHFYRTRRYSAPGKDPAYLPKIKIRRNVSVFQSYIVFLLT